MAHNLGPRRPFASSIGLKNKGIYEWYGSAGVHPEAGTSYHACKNLHTKWAGLFAPSLSRAASPFSEISADVALGTHAGLLRELDGHLKHRNRDHTRCRPTLRPAPATAMDQGDGRACSEPLAHPTATVVSAVVPLASRCASTHGARRPARLSSDARKAGIAALAPVATIWICMEHASPHT